MYKIVILFMLSTGLLFAQAGYAEFTGRQDGYGNELNSRGWSVWKIGGCNDTIRAAAYELISDASTVELGLIADEVWASSSSATDASGGNGAQSLEVTYWDTNNDIQQVTVALNGQTTVEVATDVNYIMKARVKYEGSSGQVGDIYIHNNENITAGVPDDTTATYCKIPIGKGQGGNLAFIVPDGYKAVLHKVFTFANGTTLTYRVMSVAEGEAENILFPCLFSTLGSKEEIDVNIPLSEGQRIWVEAKGTDNSDVSGGLYIFTKEK